MSIIYESSKFCAYFVWTPVDFMNTTAKNPFKIYFAKIKSVHFYC